MNSLNTPFWVAFGDIHDDISLLDAIPELAAAAGVIVTGDITLGGGVKQAERALAPIAGRVRNLWAQIGNMDREEVTDWLETRGWNLHARAREIFPGVMALGVGCSPFTPFGTPSEHPEARLAGWLDAAPSPRHLTRAVVLWERNRRRKRRWRVWHKAGRAVRPRAPVLWRITWKAHCPAARGIRLMRPAAPGKLGHQGSARGRLSCCKNPALFSPPTRPPRDTACDRLSNGAHVGSTAVREFIETHQPDLCLCGHIHESRGEDRIGRTQVLNTGPLSSGGYALVFQREIEGELRVAARLMTLR